MHFLRYASLFWLAMLFVGSATAGEPRSLEKLKTGILPSGGFYSIYQVTCADNRDVVLGSTSRRGGPWCVGEAGQLQCFRRSADASHHACALGELADSESNLKEREQYH